MGVCMTIMAAATWLEWLRSPANWLVVLQVAAGLGFVIFVHELGHFLVAKACGVKCEKFYLGFDIGGLRLAKFRWGETEYGIGALPLGGYVKMLGQDDNPAAAAAEAQRARLSGDLPPEPVAGPHPAWDPRSYPAQSVGERMAIISAGVIMNVIFAVLMASWAYGLGVKELTCAMSSVRPGGAAWRAGLRTGDEIVAIGGRRDPIFNDLKHGVTVGSVAEGVAFEVRRPGEASVRTVVLKADTDLGAPTIGVSNPWSLVLLEELPKRLPGSAAAAEPPLAGGDVIEAVDGAAVKTYAELIAALSRNAATPVRLTIRRPAKQPDGPTETLTVTLPPQPRRTTGMTMTAGAVTAVQDGSPAAAAGIRAGDRIIAIDGEATGDPLTLDSRLRKRAGGTVTLRLARSGEPDVDLPIEPREVTWIDDESNWPGSPVSIAALGVTVAVDPTIASVEADGPAARAGIVPGERVVHARFIEPDGSDATRGKGIDLSDKAATWPSIAAVLQQTPPGTRLELTIDGPGAASRQVEIDTDATDGLFIVDRGLLFEPLSTMVKAGSLPAALRKGGRKTLQDLSLVYGFLRKLTSNQISPRLLGGPIEIAKQAGRSAREGFSSLLLFLTMLSANLAVVNFLPIPVLDGGHMVFLAYEWLRGKPPSEGVVAVLSYLGLALMITLMMFVFGLDLGLIPRH